MNIEWDSLGFGLTPVDFMYVATAQANGPWSAGEIKPFGDIAFSPAAGVLNYGQGIFEGMKASRTQDGEIVLFRPDCNAKRFYAGAERLCMPPVPDDQFIAAVNAVVKANADYVPPYGKGSLYIRPCLWGSGPILGVGPAPSYHFVIYVSPVGPYYKHGLKPIRVLVDEHYHRAAPMGIGHVKSISNYAGTLLSIREAKAAGYDACVYLDARHSRYIEEVGTANFFCVKDNILLTPKLGTILPGITRDSILHLARAQGYRVEETDISLDDIKTATELFCCGTAAVITPIGLLAGADGRVIFENHQIGTMTKSFYEELTAIQQKHIKGPTGWVVPVDLLR
jgi:branched-chain amino acid aminotransferase